MNKNNLDRKDKDILNLFIEMGIQKKLAESLVYISKIEDEKKKKTKKKGKKYLVNIYDEEEEEMEE